MASDVCFAPDITSRGVCFWCLHPLEAHPVWPCANCKAEGCTFFYDDEVLCRECEGRGRVAHHPGWSWCETCFGYGFNFRGEECPACDGHAWTQDDN